MDYIGDYYRGHEGGYSEFIDYCSHAPVAEALVKGCFVEAVDSAKMHPTDHMTQVIPMRRTLGNAKNLFKGIFTCQNHEARVSKTNLCLLLLRDPDISM